LHHCLLCLSVLHNYFGLTKLFLDMYLIKFLNILAIPFFPCAIAIYNHAYSFYLSLFKLNIIYFFPRGLREKKTDVDTRHCTGTARLYSSSSFWVLSIFCLDMSYEEIIGSSILCISKKRLTVLTSYLCIKGKLCNRK